MKNETLEGMAKAELESDICGVIAGELLNKNRLKKEVTHSVFEYYSNAGNAVQLYQIQEVTELMIASGQIIQNITNGGFLLSLSPKYEATFLKVGGTD